MRELQSRGLWTEAVIGEIKRNEGSIQGIEAIPADVREVYRTAWELPMRSLIDMAAARGAYIDQSQSLNLFMESPTIGKLSSMYLHAWKSGLKTTYYLRSRPATRINKTGGSEGGSGGPGSPGGPNGSGPTGSGPGDGGQPQVAPAEGEYTDYTTRVRYCIDSESVTTASGVSGPPPASSWSGAAHAPVATRAVRVISRTCMRVGVAGGGQGAPPCAPVPPLATFEHRSVSYRKTIRRNTIGLLSIGCPMADVQALLPLSRSLLHLLLALQERARHSARF